MQFVLSRSAILMFLYLNMGVYCKRVNSKLVDSGNDTDLKASTESKTEKLTTSTTTLSSNTTETVESDSKDDTEMLALRLEEKDKSFVVAVDLQQEFTIYTEHGDLSNISTPVRFWLSKYDSCYNRYNNPAFNIDVTVDLEASKSRLFSVMRARLKAGSDSDTMYPFKLCMEPAEEYRTPYTRIEVSDSRRLLIVYICVICATALFSALFTGMNLGLMSLSIENLELIKEHGDPKSKVHAANILPIRRDGNFLLTTIIIGNTLANIGQTIAFEYLFQGFNFPDEVLRTLATVFAPSLVILIIGEIIPQVICTKYALAIGSRTRHIMMSLMVVTFVVSYPTSKMLDWALGKEPKQYYDRNKLAGLVSQQKRGSADKCAGTLEDNEDARLTGVLIKTIKNLPQKTATEVMTRSDKMTMLSDTTVIDSMLLQRLHGYRHTRFPIYKGEDKNTITGVLNVKDLVLVNECMGLQLSTVIQLWYRSTLFRFVSANAPIAQLMLEMSHGIPIVIVVDFVHQTRSYQVVGMLTLEDVMEEVIGEIQDEKDVFDYSTFPTNAHCQGKKVKMALQNKNKKEASIDEDIRTVEEGTGTGTGTGTIPTLITAKTPSAKKYALTDQSRESLKDPKVLSASLRKRGGFSNSGYSAKAPDKERKPLLLQDRSVAATPSAAMNKEPDKQNINKRVIPSPLRNKSIMSHQSKDKKAPPSTGMSIPSDGPSHKPKLVLANQANPQIAKEKKGPPSTARNISDSPHS